MKDNGLSQTTLFLRLLCGGYLLAEGAATVLFAAAAVVFILVGGGLLFFTLRAGLQNWKKGGPDSRPDDDKE